MNNTIIEKEEQDISTETTVSKIAGTTYIVSSKYKENTKEGLLDKLWRLIEKDEN